MHEASKRERERREKICHNQHEQKLVNWKTMTKIPFNSDALLMNDISLSIAYNTQ